MFALTPYERAERSLGWNPFWEMEALEHNFFGGNALAAFRTDVTDADDAYLLEADLPGFDRKDIHLDVRGDVLSLRAERRSAHSEEDEGNRLIRSERSYGVYSREFNLDGVDAEGIRARYEDGVLKLRLPKKQNSRVESRAVEIE